MLRAGSNGPVGHRSSPRFDAPSATRHGGPRRPISTRASQMRSAPGSNTGGRSTLRILQGLSHGHHLFTPMVRPPRPVGNPQSRVADAGHRGWRAPPSFPVTESAVVKRSITWANVGTLLHSNLRVGGLTSLSVSGSAVPRTARASTVGQQRPTVSHSKPCPLTGGIFQQPQRSNPRTGSGPQGCPSSTGVRPAKGAALLKVN